MAAKKSTSKPRVPKVRIARPSGRPIQLRYSCPVEGREIRISTDSYDEDVVLEQKKALEAKLLLGIDAKPRKRTRGPQMLWEDFREEYRDLKLSTLRDASADHADMRLDVIERILKPRTLADVANAASLQRLQADLLAGVESRQPKPPKPKQGEKAKPTPLVVTPRSPHTVRSYMVSTMAALNWARDMDWLPKVPKVHKVKTSKLRSMRGRPLVAEEFDRMLDKTADVVGEAVADSWKRLLRGLWESGLRIDELMHVAWDVPGAITPRWKRGRLPVLEIPAPMQKNNTEESIPLLERFEAVLLETPEEERTGWVFNPGSLMVKHDRPTKHIRPNAEWVAKIVGKIGKRAGIIVLPGPKPKYASAHDLRRSLADRLQNEGYPERDVALVMRHRSVATTRRHYAPGDVQQAAGRFRKAYLGTPVLVN